MRCALASLAFSLTIVVACGGSTDDNLFSDGGAGGGEGGSSSGGDGGPRPKVESLVTCSGPGTCELGATGCCGLGCQPDSDLLAIRRGEGPSLIDATCEAPASPCPACARQLDPNLQAFCIAGRCEVVDLRQSELSSCETNADCVLRYATCCQPCDGGSLYEIVSLREGKEGDLSVQLCSGTERCDRCLPSFPPGATARCNTRTRHCEVVTR